MTAFWWDVFMLVSSVSIAELVKYADIRAISTRTP